MSKSDQKKKKADREAKERAESGTGLAAFLQKDSIIAQEDPTSSLELATNRPIYQTGCLMVDRLIGMTKTIDGVTYKGVGVPAGVLIEVAGEPGAGKTTLCLSLAKSVLSQGKQGIYLNCEQALDFNYAENLGLDLNDQTKIAVRTPATYEKTYHEIHEAILQAKVGVLVIDSMSTLLSEDSLNSSTLDKSKVAEAAAFWSKVMPKIIKLANDNQVLIIGVNQYRVTDIGQHGKMPKKQTMGGNAIKYYKSIAIGMVGKPIKEEVENEFGQKLWAETKNEVTVKIDKNKFGNPGGAGVVTINFGKGFDNYDSLSRLAIGKGLITVKGGGYYLYESSNGNEFSIRGQENLIPHLQSHTESLKEICERLQIYNPKAYFPELAGE